MFKKVIVSILLVLFVFTLSACTSGDEGSSAEGLAWPSQYMSTLPEPASLISNIQMLNGTEEIEETDTTTQPTSVNVTMNEMTKKEATAYYEAIKASGVEINSDTAEDGQILLVGVLNDADKNLFLFSYTEDDHFGNVSITLTNAITGN